MAVKVWMCVLIFLVVGCSTVDRVDVVYHVGDRGPGGGYIFYDDEADGVDDLPDVRYLEAAPKDVNGVYAWGPDGESIGGFEGSALGSGGGVTEKIVSAYPEDTFAAHMCDQYRAGWRGDWFLPSRVAMVLMYRNLKAKGVGGFTDSVYMTAGEDDPYYVEVVDFSDGRENIVKKSTKCKVRPIRAF